MLFTNNTFLLWMIQYAIIFGQDRFWLGKTTNKGSITTTKRITLKDINFMLIDINIYTESKTELVQRTGKRWWNKQLPKKNPQKLNQRKCLNKSKKKNRQGKKIQKLILPSSHQLSIIELLILSMKIWENLMLILYSLDTLMLENQHCLVESLSI